MSEKILGNRKVKADKGKVVRISTEVWNIFQKKRVASKNRSWDSLFRRILGLPARDGADRAPLIEGYLEVTTGRFFLAQGTSAKALEAAEQDAHELAIIEAARAKTKRVHKPIRLREYV